MKALNFWKEVALDRGDFLERVIETRRSGRFETPRPAPNRPAILPICGTRRAARVARTDAPRCEYRRCASRKNLGGSRSTTPPQQASKGSCRHCPSHRKSSWTSKLRPRRNPLSFVLTG